MQILSSSIASVDELGPPAVSKACKRLYRLRIDRAFAASWVAVPRDPSLSPLLLVASGNGCDIGVDGMDEARASGASAIYSTL